MTYCNLIEILHIMAKYNHFKMEGSVDFSPEHDMIYLYGIEDYSIEDKDKMFALGCCYNKNEGWSIYF